MKCEKPDQYDYLIALSTLEASDDDVKTFTALDDSDVVLSDHTTDEIDKMIRKESVYRRSGFKRFGKILSRVRCCRGSRWSRSRVRRFGLHLTE